MYRNILFTTLSVLLISVSSSAQSSTQPPRPLFHQMGFLSWNPGFPMNNDFTSETSYRGGSFGFRKMMKSGKISLGADVSWNSFDEYAPRQTYTTKNDGAVTTDFIKYMYTLPMAVTAHYHFGSGAGVINPYAGIGIGATWARQQLYYNTYLSEDDEWGFLVRPEVGAIINFKPYSPWGILVAARYHYATNEQTDFKISSLEFVDVQVGITWNW